MLSMERKTSPLLADGAIIFEAYLTNPTLNPPIQPPSIVSL
jgi:hypothetical protein